jgi:hypothetical protein
VVPYCGYDNFECAIYAINKNCYNDFVENIKIKHIKKKTLVNNNIIVVLQKTTGLIFDI